MGTKYIREYRKHTGERIVDMAQRIVEGRSLTQVGREYSTSKQYVEQMLLSKAYTLDHPAVIGRVNEYGVSELKVIYTIKGLTIRKLAVLAEVSVVSLTTVLQGGVIKYSTAQKVADALQLPIGVIFEEVFNGVTKI